MTRRRITHVRRTSDQPDPAITALLREAHAPPSAPGYWDSLESRVMARVRTARDGAALPRLAMSPAAEWWQVMNGWAGAGAWAAGAAAVVSAFALAESRAAERRVAYATVLEATTVAPAAPDAPPPGTPTRAVAPGADSEHEAAVRYVLSPR